MTRGCRTAYPSTTLPAMASKRGWFSGCAILPIRRRTVSRGNLVSASSVMTYRTSAGTAGDRPFHCRKVVSLAPRNNRFNS